MTGRRGGTKRGYFSYNLAADIFGLDFPQYDVPPTVDAGLLRETARLLRKHGFIAGKEVRLDDFVDNSLVREAMGRIASTDL
ncbi:MAG: hypothetical protein HY922_12295 [Elusimicrobia bacterium]|nr:hypothetical protein [Elusimicrobiota bacterium]